MRVVDLYHVMTAVTPLYVSMMLAYASVKWWKIFTPEQCSGINRFVALFAVPLLSFHFISNNNPYTMNLKFIAADTLQKAVILSLLAAWATLTSRGSLDWMITLFSLSTLPNTLVMGIPLLRGMYGDFSGDLMVQIVVLQCILWYTLMLFMFEYRAARSLISDQFPVTAASIVSIRVDSDVISLDNAVETETEVKGDGKLRVTVRKSNASRSDVYSRTPQRPSNLTNAEIYSLQSSRIPTPRGSSFSHADFYSMGRGSNFGSADVQAASKGPNPRPSNYDEDSNSKAGRVGHPGSNPKEQEGGNGNGNLNGGRDLHMFVWSSSMESPVSDALRRNGGVEQEAKGGNGKGGGDEVELRLGMAPSSVMSRLIMIMVWRKLIRNPNTYSSLIGLVWSLVCFKWGLEMPAIIAKSISILSDGGLGMAMFSLGLFMALQSRILGCGYKKTAYAMSVRFLTGPAVMAASSIAVGLRGDLLRVAIVQAALPQGIVPFVFAKEYNLHPHILSTAVIFGMLIALPITLVYYILLGL